MSGTEALIELLAALERRVAERIEVQEAEIARLNEENEAHRATILKMSKLVYHPPTIPIDYELAHGIPEFITLR